MLPCALNSQREPKREVELVHEVEVQRALPPCAVSSKESPGPNSVRWDSYTK